MENVFSMVLYLIYGFLGLLAVLFVLAMLFGKRIRKQWEFEAEFRDAAGREFGELDIENSRIEKEEPEFSFKASFKLRHDSLEVGQVVQVYLDGLLVMQGNVAQVGRIYLRDEAVVNEVTNPQEGQVCRVVFGGREQFSAPIRPD